MKKSISILLAGFIIISSIFLSGCQAIGDIFKAGVWVGVIIVILIIALIIFIISRAGKS